MAECLASHYVNLIPNSNTKTNLNPADPNPNRNPDMHIYTSAKNTLLVGLAAIYLAGRTKMTNSIVNNMACCVNT